MKTLVIIPAYNEQDSILNTIEDIKQNCAGVDYIVINDCSTDGTRKVLEENNIPFLNLPINLGIGGGVQSGYRYAMDRGYDVAIQFDGDGQHMAQYIKDLIVPIQSGQADMTIGSRFIKKEGFQSSPLRRFGITFLSNLIYLLCGMRVYDVTSGMRAVNRKMIQEFANNYPQDYPEPDAIIIASQKGARIQEVAVQMRERVGGVSSINPIRSVYYMIKVSLSLILARISC